MINLIDILEPIENRLATLDHTPDLLQRLEVAQDIKEDAAQLERDLVYNALKAGHTWQEIGDAIGITRQSAHQRFAQSIHEADDGESVT